MNIRVLASEVNQLVDQVVTMSGWAQTVRAHAKVVFIDLRDRTGLTQCVFTGDLVEAAKSITTESVLVITGTVTKRPESLINTAIISGAIEVQVTSLIIETIAEHLPFPLSEENVSEEVRLKYRYLDIRRQRVARNLHFRSNANQFIRTFLIENDFVEVETP